MFFPVDGFGIGFAGLHCHRLSGLRLGLLGGANGGKDYFGAKAEKSKHSAHTRADKKGPEHEKLQFG
jgi:hypothetical protein